MEKAVIVGTYEFVGFHLCKKLLEAGLEVIGVHVPSGEEKVKIEEKRLEIGRNSNFYEMDITEWNDQKENSFHTIILNFYDFFMKEKENILFEQLNGDLKKRFHFLLPVSSLIGEKFSPFTKAIHRLIDKIKQNNGHCQLIYLPTIFGPWQPEHFVFQQIIEKNEFTVSPREWRQHALYIDEVVNELIQLMNHEGEEFLIVDEAENSWNECLHRLNKKLDPVADESPIRFTGIKKIVKRKTDIRVALNEQKRHYEYFCQLKKWNN